MRKTVSSLLATGCLLTLVVGCHHARPPACQPSIQIDDWAAGLSAPDNAFLLLQAERTAGRFACGLAIAKLGRGPDGPDEPPQVVTMQPREEAYWSDVFRGVPVVRDLAFLSPISVRPEQDGPAGLCVAAERVGAALVLVHWPNVIGANSTEMLGVLYDAASRTPLATLHASARYTDEGGEEEPPDRKPGDHRDIDATFQAGRAFQRHARTCLLELAALDIQRPKPQPHRWETERQDRWWLPTRIRVDQD